MDNFVHVLKHNLKTLHLNIPDRVQVLCLPEGFGTEADLENFVDTLDGIQLSKLLKEQGVRCANSYDIGLTAPMLERGSETWLGTVVIWDGEVIPVVCAAIKELTQTAKVNHPQHDPLINAEIYIEDIRYNVLLQGKKPLSNWLLHLQRSR